MNTGAPDAWSGLPAAEADLCRRFMAEGHVIVPAADRAALDALQRRAAALAAAHLGLPAPDDATAFLDTIHHAVSPAALNPLRLAVIQGLNAWPEARPLYHALGRAALETVAGNELAMQRRLNLSIQLPGDDSSLLPAHADLWSGDSPFEVVLWVPLVDCFASKSMYLLPPAAHEALEADFARFAGQSGEALFQAIAADVRFLSVPYGSVLLFSQNLLHGNRVNSESASRWSMNCRFKSLLSPYADKRLGEFFEPLVIRPATRLGMRARLPGGFHD